MGKREDKKHDIENKILIAMHDLTSTKSYKDITIRDLCKYANISIGTYYNYFKSKDDILIKAMENASEKTKQSANLFDSEDDIANIVNYLNMQSSISNNLSVEWLSEIYRMFLFNEGSFILDDDSINFKTIQPIVLKGQNSGVFSTKYSDHELSSLVLKIILGNHYSWCMQKGAFDLKSRLEKDVLFVLLK